MDSDHYTCGTCQHGNLYDNCAQCEAESEAGRDHEILARKKMIRDQAANGDAVCAALLAESAMNHACGNGQSWIDTQLDMEDEYDDFRPY